MDALEDVRDRSFEWNYLSGFPLDVLIMEGDQNAGRLRRTSNNEPEVLARFAGVEWRVRERDEIGSCQCKIAFTGGPVLGEGRSHLLRSFRVVLDGRRTYELGKDSYTQSRWYDERGDDAVIFHRPGMHDDAPKSGRILVPRGAELLDAPPLVVIGLMMACEGHLFKHLGASHSW